jgi:glutaredoxin 3
MSAQSPLIMRSTSSNPWRSYIALLAKIALVQSLCWSVVDGFQAFPKSATTERPKLLYSMKRPILDILASTMFQLEKSRVEASSEVDEQGRSGEPMRWSESDSLANRFSEMVASNSLGYQFKQFVADIAAGEYDEELVRSNVDAFISGSSSAGGETDNNKNTSDNQQARVVIFSFTTCPFCRRAKDYLDERGISYSAMELDELNANEGNQIRAILGKMTRRTSVPSIFVGGVYIGGCNDGPGLLPMAESGELDKLLFLQ